MITPIPTGIQSGAKTHHQDHVITFVNFRTMKAIVRSWVKDIPLTTVSFSFAIFLKIFLTKIKCYPNIVPIGP